MSKCLPIWRQLPDFRGSSLEASWETTGRDHAHHRDCSTASRHFLLHAGFRDLMGSGAGSDRGRIDPRTSRDSPAAIRFRLSGDASWSARRRDHNHPDRPGFARAHGFSPSFVCLATGPTVVRPRGFSAPLTVLATDLLLSFWSPDFLPAVLLSERDAGPVGAASPAAFVFTGLAVGVGAGFFEELGWTGFATPTLRARYGITWTGMVLGII